jgi:hypothetical protein
MRTFKMVVTCFLLMGVLAAAVAQQVLKLVINGKPSTLAPITVQGKTYIALDSLKAAGVTAQVKGGTIELTLPSRQTSDGGANQQGAVEGKAGEWLFNGIWRFRVILIEKADPATIGAGWLVKVEIRNGSKFSGYAPSGTGWKGITLVTEDGNSIPAASDASDLRDMGLAQGAGNTQSVFFPTEAKSKPIRVILRFDPAGLQGTPAGLRFTTSDPSFRIDVKAIARPND